MYIFKENKGSAKRVLRWINLSHETQNIFWRSYKASIYTEMSFSPDLKVYIFYDDIVKIYKTNTVIISVFPSAAGTIWNQAGTSKVERKI